MTGKNLMTIMGYTFIAIGGTLLGGSHNWRVLVAGVLLIVGTVLTLIKELTHDIK